MLKLKLKYYCIHRFLDSQEQKLKALALVFVNSSVPTEKMQKSSYAPTSTILYAFHNFGRPDRKSVMSRTA